MWLMLKTERLVLLVLFKIKITWHDYNKKYTTKVSNKTMRLFNLMLI